MALKCSLLQLVGRFGFSQTTRVTRYATKKQRELVGRGKEIRRKNKFVEGMNEANTNFLQLKAPSNELKPIQHPVHL